MVYEAAKAAKTPIIGIGGIVTASDALEFLIAGASAVQVGTANFLDPEASIKVLEGIENYMKRHSIKRVGEITGSLR